MKDKNTAAMFGIFLGGFGAHKFYLGENGTGLFFLLFCWTGIPFIIGIIQGLNLLGMNQVLFDAQYNGRALPPGGLPGNIVVNVSPSIGYGPPQGALQQAQPPMAQMALPPAGGDLAARISALHDLKVAGALTEDEFTAAKQKLLLSGKSGS
jgi:TM2 domain-containing membrane protein YozV